MITYALRGIRRRQPTGFQQSVNRVSHDFRNRRNHPGNALLTVGRIVYKHFAALVGHATLWTGSARPTGRGAHTESHTMESNEPTRRKSGHDSKRTASERFTDDGLAVHASANKLAEEYVSRLFLQAEADTPPVGRHLCAQQTIADNLRLKAGPNQWLSSDTATDLTEVR